MDHEHFDTLTRMLAGGGGTRRAAMRLLVGGALTGLAARLGLAELAEAEAKQHPSKKHADLRSRRNPPPHQRSKGVHAAGKHKGKSKGKDKGRD